MNLRIGAMNLHVICNMFVTRDEDKKVAEATGYVSAAVLGIIGGVFAAMCPFISKATIENPGVAIFAVVILIATLAGFIALAVAWAREGSKVGELICAVIICIMFFWLSRQAASAATTMMTSASLAHVFQLYPT